MNPYTDADGHPFEPVIICEPPHDPEHLRRLLAEHRPDARVVVLDRAGVEERVRELAVAVPAATMDRLDIPLPDLSAYGPVTLNRAQRRARSRR